MRSMIIDRCPDIYNFKQSLRENKTQFADKSSFKSYPETDSSSYKTGWYDSQKTHVDPKRTKLEVKTSKKKPSFTWLWISAGVAVAVILFMMALLLLRKEPSQSYYYDTATGEVEVEEITDDSTVEGVVEVEEVPAEEAAPSTETYSRSQFISDFHTDGCEVYTIRIGDVGSKMYYYADGPEDAYAVIILNDRVFKFRGGQDEGLSGLDEIGGSGSLYLDWNIRSGEMQLGASSYDILLP